MQHLSGVGAAVCTALATLLSGCASTTQRPWGEEATLVPGWAAFGRAVYRAAADPKTWVPLAGATLVHVMDQDHKISAWAADHKPLFGSDAGGVSDQLKRVTDVSFTLTALATSSGNEPDAWLVNKAKGFLVANAAFTTTAGVTDLTKEQVGRMRPNGANTRSFISGHTSYAASRVAFAMRNVDYIAMPESARTVASAGLYSLSAGMAWARVEDGAHYPTDVLAAMAVGNFLANLFNDTFLVPNGESARVSIQPLPQGSLLVLSLPF